MHKIFMGVTEVTNCQKIYGTSSNLLLLYKLIKQIMASKKLLAKICLNSF